MISGKKETALYLSAIVLFIVILLNCYIVNLAQAAEFDRNYIISDEELTDYNSMTVGEIQDFLTNGPGKTGTLGNYEDVDTNGKKHLASEIIYNASQRYKINPKFLLVLLQREQSLITDPSPTSKQLQCATGYTCGDYKRLVGFVARYGGFTKQVDRAAWRFRYYLEHPWEFNHRKSLTSLTMDRDRIIPQNIATASLYNYAPHIWDNLLLWRIWNNWNKWFGEEEFEYPDGSLLKTEDSPDVWFIQRNTRRLFHSLNVFLSSYNFAQVQIVPREVLEKYKVGPDMQFPNYSLLRTPVGGIYLLANGKRRPIVSERVFRAIGFHPNEVIPVDWQDLERLPVGEAVATPYPNGVLLQNKVTGSVWYVENDKKFPIWSEEILLANFPSNPLIQVHPGEFDLFKEVEPLKFRDGMLVKSLDHSAVFVISGGKRRPVTSAEIFEALGYQWEAIVEVEESILQIHPLGEIIDVDTTIY